MAKKFDLIRHSKIKAKLIEAAKRAETDARIYSVGMRFYILALRLRKMNESNGFKGQPIAKPSLDEIKTAFIKMKQGVSK